LPPLPACGERVGVRGSRRLRTMVVRHLKQPLTPTLSPLAGRGRKIKT
jgi:hypothetical protein